MAKKKSNSKKPAVEKTMMIKIAEKVGEMAGEIVNKKEHLVEMATGAIQSAKASIKNITTKKKTTQKEAVKTIVKKADKKIVQPLVKKATKVVAKKAPAAKKTIRKAAAKKK